jgi:hypothetical protein
VITRAHDVKSPHGACHAGFCLHPLLPWIFVAPIIARKQKRVAGSYVHLQQPKDTAKAKAQSERTSSPLSRPYKFMQKMMAGQALFL